MNIATLYIMQENVISLNASFLSAIYLNLKKIILQF